MENKYEFFTKDLSPKDSDKESIFRQRMIDMSSQLDEKSAVINHLLSQVQHFQKVQDNNSGKHSSPNGIKGSVESERRIHEQDELVKLSETYNDVLLDEIVEENQNGTSDSQILVSSSSRNIAIETNNNRTETKNKLVGVSNSLEMFVNSLVHSDNLNDFRDEIISKLQSYDMVRRSNAKLLSKLQSLQGTIQVCCRYRPPNSSEVNAGGRIVVDAVETNELVCFDL
jgi:hypothetical protein